MPRETKEERQAREAQERQEQEEALAKFRATIPTRLMTAQALASDVGINTSIRLTADGPTVRFYCDDDNKFMDDTIGYTSDEWEIEHVERILKERKAEQIARAARYDLAIETFSKLTAEQKAAIKEFIYALR